MCRGGGCFEVSHSRAAPGGTLSSPGGLLSSRCDPRPGSPPLSSSPMETHADAREGLQETPAALAPQCLCR